MIYNIFFQDEKKPPYPMESEHGGRGNSPYHFRERKGSSLFISPYQLMKYSRFEIELSEYR
jgi:hypothetical protein